MKSYVEYNLKLGYKNVSDKNFVPDCKNVIASLKDNVNFPDVGPLLKELEKVFNDYYASIPAKQESSSVKVAAKDAKRDIVKIMMRTVGFHVLMVARNDYEKLKSSGFSIAKQRGENAPVDMPMPVILGMNSNGTANQLIVKCKATNSARLYDVRTSIDQENWLVTTDTTATVKVNNLPTETVIYVSLRYRNGDHRTPWSGAIPTRIFGMAVASPIAN